MPRGVRGGFILLRTHSGAWWCAAPHAVANRSSVRKTRNHFLSIFWRPPPDPLSLFKAARKWLGFRVRFITAKQFSHTPLQLWCTRSLTHDIILLMEPDNYNEEEIKSDPLSGLKTIAPFSKYLALVLFVLLPFSGGWIGYTLAPEKVVEIERVTEVERVTDQDLRTEAVSLAENDGVKICQTLPPQPTFSQFSQIEFTFPPQAMIDIAGIEEYCPPVDWLIHNWHLPIIGGSGVEFAVLEDERMTNLYYLLVKDQGEQSILELNLYNSHKQKTTEIASTSVDTNMLERIAFKERIVPELSSVGLLLYNWVSTENDSVSYTGRIRSSEFTIETPCPFSHVPDNYDGSMHSRFVMSCDDGVYYAKHEQASRSPFGSFIKHSPKEIDFSGLRPRVEFATPNTIIYTVYYEHLKPTRYIFDLEGNLLHSESYTG